MRWIRAHKIIEVCAEIDSTIMNDSDDDVSMYLLLYTRIFSIRVCIIRFIFLYYEVTDPGEPVKVTLHIL